MRNKTILLFGILVATMSSCVYSLFPIYTDDTLVFKEELLGKWQTGEGPDEYLEFVPFSEKNESLLGKTFEGKEEGEYKYRLEVKEGFVMSSNEPLSIMHRGKKVYNEDTIRQVMLERFADAGSNDRPANAKMIDQDSLDRIKSAAKNMEFLGQKGTTDDRKISSRDFEGTITVHEEKSYKMIVHENDKEEQYIVHLVEIGEDLFLDLYPIVEFGGGTFSENYFPVHTFLKVKVFQDRLDFTFFDLEKLNKLFESNLIRMRHENVEGSILITAQPKELQKFIDKYSDDESVFDSTESYLRVGP